MEGRKRYRLDKQLGAGAFGEIYSGVDTENGNKVAVKLERVDAEYPQLVYEARVYKRLEAQKGIPRLFYIGQEGSYNVLVMQRLGDNLETLFNKCHRRFSLSTVLLLADKMLNLIMKIHSEGFVHRDIKPDNFVVGGEGEGEDSEVYIIDFGLSKCYMNPQTKQHIEFRNDKHLTGTARYASVGNHKGEEQSRRDDLESLGYVLVYFLKGVLPWQNMKKTTPEHKKYRGMMAVKIATVHNSTQLVDGLPDAFAKYFAHVKQLTFEQTPDYRYLRRLFYDCFVSTVSTNVDENSTGEDGKTGITSVPAKLCSVVNVPGTDFTRKQILNTPQTNRQVNRFFDWQ